MNDIEQLLDEAGASWRVGQPPPPPLRLDAPRRRAWLPVAAGVGAVAASAVVVTVLASVPGRSGTAQPGGKPPTQVSSTPSVGVRPGDAVLAVGYVVHDAQGWAVCRPPYGLSPTSVCGTVSVPLIGMRSSLLPPGFPAATRGVPEQQPPKGPLVVKGTWTGRAIRVSGLKPSGSPVPYPTEGEPDVPCAAPPGGWDWSGQAHDPNAAKGAQLIVQAAVAQHPDRYSGAWAAVPAAQQGTLHYVMVVGAVGSPAAAESELRAVYDLPLCVVHVERSLAQLQAEGRALVAAHPNWDYLPLARLDRVWVTVAVDDADAAALATDPAVLLDPLVRRP